METFVHAQSHLLIEDNLDIRQQQRSNPFHKPTVDILIRIFELSSPHIYHEKLSVREAPLNVSHVCQYWREVSLLMPKLWSRLVMHGKVKYELISMMFDRTATYPLDVHIDFVRTRSRVTNEVKRFIAEKLLSVERHRLRRLHLKSTLPLIPLHLRPSGLPGYLGGLASLEELDLRITDLPWNYATEPLVLDLSESTQLKLLKCAGQHVQFLQLNHSWFKHLLEIYLELGADTPSDTYFAIVRSAPAVELCTISFPSVGNQDTNFGHGNSNIPESPRTYITTPRLKYLALVNRDDRPWSMSSIQLFETLRAIDAPTLQILNLLDFTSHGWGNATTQLELSLLSFLKRSQRSLTSVTLSARLHEPALVACINELRNVQHLTMESQSCSHTVVSALRRSLGPPQSCPMPNLRNISILCDEFTASGDELSGMLVSRWINTDSVRAAGTDAKGTQRRVLASQEITFQLRVAAHQYSSLDVASFDKRDEIQDLMKRGLVIRLEARASMYS